MTLKKANKVIWNFQNIFESFHIFLITSFDILNERTNERPVRHSWDTRYIIECLNGAARQSWNRPTDRPTGARSDDGLQLPVVVSPRTHRHIVIRTQAEKRAPPSLLTRSLFLFSTFFLIALSSVSFELYLFSFPLFVFSLFFSHSPVLSSLTIHHANHRRERTTKLTI